MPGRLAEAVQVLVASTGPHELPVQGAAGSRGLAPAVNALAKQRDALRQEMAAQVAQASRDVEQERNRLAALMSTLMYALMYALEKSVVVCHLDGRILLYKARARQQFHALASAPGGGPAIGGADAIGLGRSIYAVLDRRLAAHALEAVQRRLRRGIANPAARFVTGTHRGHLLRLPLAPVRSTIAGNQAPRGGFVPMLDNITHDLAEHTERDRLLHTLTEGNRGALGHLQAALELLDDAELDAPTRERFLAVIGDEIGAMARRRNDTGTTVLQPSAGDEIIQIGATRIVAARLRRQECLEQPVDRGRSIPAEIAAIHGIDPAMLDGQPAIGTVLQAFHTFAQDTVLVAHKASFDMRLLQLEEPCSGVRFGQPVLATLLLSAVIHPQQDSHRLDAIAERLAVPLPGRHTA